MEKRLVRYLVLGIMGGKDVRKMISEDAAKEVEMGEGSEDDSSNDEDSTVSDVDERRKTRLRNIAIGGVRIGRVNKRLRSGNARTIIARAVHDWHHFVEHGCISVDVWRTKRVDEETMKECVFFIFSRQNRQLMTHLSH